MFRCSFAAPEDDDHCFYFAFAFDLYYLIRITFYCDCYLLNFSVCVCFDLLFFRLNLSMIRNSV